MKKSKNMAKKPVKAAAPTAPWFNDLTLSLSEDGSGLTSTISSNAQWAGIQKFVDPTSNIGVVAIGEAQRNYSTPPGTGQTTSCPVQGAGFYRGFTSDFDYSVHVSNWVQIS